MVKLLLENFELCGKVKRGVVASTSPKVPEHPHVKYIYKGAVSQINHSLCTQTVGAPNTLPANSTRLGYVFILEMNETCLLMSYHTIMVCRILATDEATGYITSCSKEEYFCYFCSPTVPTPSCLPL